MILAVILQKFADWELAYISTAINMLGQGKYEIKAASIENIWNI